MSVPASIDVGRLPTFAYGHRSLMWWGTVSLMIVEGTVFVMAIASYFYLRTRVGEWPPSAPSPAVWAGIVNTVLMLASAVPNQFAKSASERRDLRAVQRWMVVCDAFALAFLVVRVFEFGTLGVRWDWNAYSSMAWTLLGLHTTHLVTDFIDSVVLTVLMFTGPLSGQRFVDVSENAFYWYFVVATWLPIAGVLYLAPRLL